MKVMDVLQVMEKSDRVSIIPTEVSLWDYGVNYVLTRKCSDIPWTIMDVVKDKEVVSMGIYPCSEGGTYLRVKYEV